MSEADLKPSIVAAYKRLLGPLVRILIRNSVSFPEFSEIAKEVFVEVATKDLTETDKNKAEGRVAILTGLTRSEVSRVQEESRSRKDYESQLNLVLRVLTGWHTDPDFTGPYGLPLEVPFESIDTRSFSELIRRYTDATPTRALLDELIRLEVVSESANGRIKVLTRTYFPKRDSPESLDRLGRVVCDFVGTIDFNRAEPDTEKRLFERRVSADAGLRESDVPLFHAYLRERGQFLLEELDDWISKRTPLEEHEKATSVQTGVGVYHYFESDN
ncbi:MAG: hypothetical protein FJ197_11370 [Gammaproteobacteria bacterium]|nr:hypothetical protein [Gammaproteobacteria bacterium]